MSVKPAFTGYRRLFLLIPDFSLSSGEFLRVIDCTPSLNRFPGCLEKLLCLRAKCNLVILIQFSYYKILTLDIFKCYQK